jgi:hypothetical protein
MGQRMILGNRDFGAMASRPLPGQSAGGGLIAQSRTTTPQTGGHVITLRVQLHIWMCSPLTLLAELALRAPHRTQRRVPRAPLQAALGDDLSRPRGELRRSFRGFANVYR